MRERGGVKIGRTGMYVLLVLLSSSAAEAGWPFSSSRRPPQPAQQVSIQEELSELIAHMRHDLSRAILREHADKTFQAPLPNGLSAVPLDVVLTSLVMPVVGLSPEKLYDSWGDPREGGRRRHRGIDIFVRRGTKVVAVADGTISYIGNWGKGGRSLWLTTDEGILFYYAHLDRWVPGLYEGMEVQKGEIIGHVGNTGNAARTPPHLHFAVIQNDEAVNPYPVLRRSTRAVGKPILSGGFTGGTQ